MGCAVLCEDKGHFIECIFSLDETSQTVLKRMVEEAMGKMTSNEERDSADYTEEVGENVSSAELER